MCMLGLSILPQFLRFSIGIIFLLYGYWDWYLVETGTLLRLVHLPFRWFQFIMGDRIII